MKSLLITAIAAVVLVGCAKNDINLTNKGVKEWQQIKIKAGGQVFEIKELKGGATETLRFESKAEDGGRINGELDGQVHKAEFGYFTPNMGSQFEIILDDNGTITIVEGP